MRLPWSPTCAGHRDALVDFAARRSAGPGVQRALEHVERCRQCEADLAATLLIVHALRRLHAETARVEPARDGWALLRLRLAATPRRPSLLMSGIPGLLAAVGLCSALAGPGVLRGNPMPLYDDGSWVTPRTPPAVVFEEGIDRRPAPSTSNVATIPAEAASAGPDYLPRSLVDLRSSPVGGPGLSVPDGGPQPAPAGADRR